MGKIKEKMKQEMELRGLSELTQEAYLACIRQYVKYFMNSPDKLNLEHIHAYQGMPVCLSIFQVYRPTN